MRKVPIAVAWEEKRKKEEDSSRPAHGKIPAVMRTLAEAMKHRAIS